MPDQTNRVPFGPFSISATGIICKLIDLYGGLVGINIYQTAVHDGIFFTSDGHTFKGVANNASALFRLSIGAKDLHGNIQLSTGGDAYGSLEKGTTFSAGGTSVPLVNNNDQSATAATTTLFHTPTVDVSGDSIDTETFLPGGSGPLSVGTSQSGAEHRVYKANTEYLVTIKNVSGVDQDLGIKVSGFEHPPL